MKEDTLHNAMKYGVILALLVAFALPGAALGQATGQLSLEARGGVALPAASIADITDLGGTLGGSLVWHFHPNWALRGDVDYMMLDDGEDDFGVVLSPPMDLLFFGGSVEVNFGSPKYQDFPLTFMVNVGAGAMNMKVDDTFDPGHPANAFDHTYLAFQGGAKIGYQLKDWINLFVNGTAYFMVMDSNDSLVFENVSAGVENFDTGWMVPVTAGVRLTFLR
jgi:hypothetical protein